MANEFGLFFNSINNDRTYEAGDFTEWLRKFFTSGVFSGDLAVTAGTGMRVTLGTGYCNLEGKVRFFDAPTTLNIAQANSSYPRIDTVVIECNYTDREITAKVVTGAYSGGNPQPTAPVRNDEVYQIVVAEVYVNVGATSITDAVITDTRTDTSVCGLITGTVQEMDFGQFTTQFNAWFAEFKQSESDDFDAWFEAIRGQLDEDAAGHLQNEIDALTSGGIVDIVYPVGSIYMSASSTSPATLFPGTTWTQIQDTFLLAAGSTYAAGATGGEATVTLTGNEMPSHRHEGLEYTNGAQIGLDVNPQSSTCYRFTWDQPASSRPNVRTGFSGGGQPHNNMPPYLAVYMWQRTA